MASSIAPGDLRSYAQLPPVEVVPDSELEVYINIANMLRTENFAGSSLTPQRLDAVELNLAAHFAIITYERGGLTSTMVGTSQDKYQLISDKMYGLAATRFGRAALSLDTSGVLTQLASPPLRARFNVV